MYLRCLENNVPRLINSLPFVPNKVVHELIDLVIKHRAMKAYRGVDV
jgi:hypothetical protein